MASIFHTKQMGSNAAGLLSAMHQGFFDQLGYIASMINDLLLRQISYITIAVSIRALFTNCTPIWSPFSSYYSAAMWACSHFQCSVLTAGETGYGQHQHWLQEGTSTVPVPLLFPLGGRGGALCGCSRRLFCVWRLLCCCEPQNLICSEHS